MEHAIHLENVSYRWPRAARPTIELDRLEIARGERVFVRGPSGSGKTTLLSLLAGIITPQQGTIELFGQRLEAMRGPQRDHFRADHLGYIFQMFNLVPYLSVVENVTLPLRFSRKRRRQATLTSRHPADEARRLLEHLGIASDELLGRKVSELSVGQQQRVAAARALIGAPELLIADEPTSSLDAENREAFIELLFRECAATQATLLFVSHDASLSTRFDTTVELSAGRPVALGSEQEGERP